MDTRRTGTEKARPYLESYMVVNRLTIQDVARMSGVPSAVVWRVMHDQPVTYRSAGRIRIGLGRLCGVLYTDPIVTCDEETATGPLPILNTPSISRAKLNRIHLQRK
jgi:hypothetical protein